MKSIRRNKDKLKEDKNGIYLILQGKGYLSFATKFKCKKQIESKQLLFGLINCFEKNISEIELELDDHFLLLYIKPEDFYSSLTLTEDIESFHMIKNKIIFEGETSLVNYRCWICNQFHLEGRCKILKIEVNYDKLNQQNCRRNFNKRLKKRSQRAFQIYVIHKQNDDPSIDQSESSINDSDDQFEIHADDGSGSQKVTDKNTIVTSKGNDGFPDHNTEKFYEKLRNSHLNIQIQASHSSNSQYIGENLRKSDRSIPLYQAYNKFQELIFGDDIDSVKEYAYFYPEFNISYIISLLKI